MERPADQTTAPVERLRRRRGLRAVIGLAIVVLGLGVASIERVPILQHVAAWWVVSGEPLQADAVVVLGGDTEVRPFGAANLYKRGFAGKILVSNPMLGRAERLGFIPSGAQLNIDVLEKLGVPDNSIVLLGKDLSSTEEEAAAVRQWAEQSGAKRIIVPTALFATRRTQWIFERELAPLGVQVIVYALPTGEYSAADWWQYRHGLVDFNNEVLKYLYYRAHF